MENEMIAIAIDGPAAAGKSTVAKIVAEKLSCVYIDTGAMYRALTLKAINNQVDLQNEEVLVGLLANTTIKLKQSATGQLVILDTEDVTEEIRSQEVTNNVSYVAMHPEIRREMVARQQALAAHTSVVMDGRDIGTHVLPNAEVKIFLIASVEERAKRRFEENTKKGYNVDLEELKKEIEQRDLIDSQREASPLIKAENAVEIDTTSLTIEQVADNILNEAYKVLQRS
ncbi:cytidylate kinase [Oceanobacillus picturae]|uniref:Cytidylate kinase n=1 Tax=Oceanobacillus picturae TaxID=171693 RepID=W9B5P7_9BACI|nr:(d)CMP kinase [Oceanobacillus picturae]RIU96161.1 (d)CMP kinase [Oceanobacillus picturae]GAQ17465.1 cytidylate kinase [Oceanobacillus picturae]CDO02020.1 Cytidylate kinase [Oceanobacillus picturae]